MFLNFFFLTFFDSFSGPGVWALGGWLVILGVIVNNNRMSATRGRFTCRGVYFDVGIRRSRIIVGRVAVVVDIGMVSRRCVNNEGRVFRRPRASHARTSVRKE